MAAGGSASNEGAEIALSGSAGDAHSTEKSLLGKE